MVPDKFNMVDMGGIDLIMAQGEEVPGLYNRLVESIAQCRYQCLYNWFFDGVLIPPSYVKMEVNENDEVEINEGITVSSDDVIHIYSLGPSPVDPEIIPLLVEENGVYDVPTGIDGFNPVTVDVPSYTPVISSLSISENGTYTAPSGVDGYSPVIVNVSSSDLPSGYTQKQYLEASGTQYIDTGIKAQGGCYAEVEFEFPSSISGWHAIISGENANIDRAFKFFHNGMTGGTVQNNTNYYDFSKSFQVSQKYRACVANGLVIDGEFFQKFTKTTFLSANDIAIFANITGAGTVEAYFIGRVYSCKMWINGEIVRNFIPCVRDSDSEPGMYDTVNAVFYTNDGTGNFVTP